MTSIKRVPITGIQRVPIIQNRHEWDEVYKKNINYVKFAAGSTFRKYKTVDPEDLFQEGQIIMYRCWLLYGAKPIEEFGAILKASIWRRMNELSKKRRVLTTDLETLEDKGQEPGYQDDWDTPMEEDEKLKQVAKLIAHDPIALTILREFVTPSPRTVWEAKMDMERKLMLRAQGYNVIVPATIQPTKRTIQRAMEIPQVLFNEHYKIMKKAMFDVYQPNIPDYSVSTQANAVILGGI